jgi:hypothetical protein
MATAINMATDIIMVIFQKNPKSLFGENGFSKMIQVNKELKMSLIITTFFNSTLAQRNLFLI